MTNRQGNNSRDDKPNLSADRRDFLTGAAALAVTALGTERALAGGHEGSPSELTVADKTARPVGEGAVILVTGANRGLGLEFTKQYAERGARIIATARRPDKADELNALAAENKRVTVEQLDVTDFAGIDELAKRYSDQPIDQLLNNAGIGGDSSHQIFGRMNFDTFDQVMAVNVKGPMKMCEAFLPHVQASHHKKMVAVSSSQGSIGSVSSPMLYWYRSSKAALNMCMVNLAAQLQPQRVIVGLVTPGATATDFIPEQFRSRIPSIQQPPVAAADMMRNIDRFTVANTGTFYNYDGTIVPW